MASEPSKDYDLVVRLNGMYCASERRESAEELLLEVIRGDGHDELAAAYERLRGGEGWLAAPCERCAYLEEQLEECRVDLNRIAIPDAPSALPRP